MEESKNVHVYVDEAAIARYVFKRLIDKGYAVTNEEAFVLGEIMFDFLVETSVIEDYEEFEEDMEDED